MLDVCATFAVLILATTASRSCVGEVSCWKGHACNFVLHTSCYLHVGPSIWFSFLEANQRPSSYSSTESEKSSSSETQHIPQKTVLPLPSLLVAVIDATSEAAVGRNCCSNRSIC